VGCLQNDDADRSVPLRRPTHGCDLATHSTVILDPDADALRDRVRELLRTHPETRGRSEVDVRYVVRAYRWRP